jgi:hypothetical protein
MSQCATKTTPTNAPESDAENLGDAELGLPDSLGPGGAELGFPVAPGLPVALGLGATVDTTSIMNGSSDDTVAVASCELEAMPEQMAFPPFRSQSKSNSTSKPAADAENV